MSEEAFFASQNKQKNQITEIHIQNAFGDF